MDDEAGQVGGGEEQVGAERDLRLAQADRQAGEADAGGEPALLVIFAVIGKEALRHHAEDAAAVERYGGIVEAAIADKRGADEQQGGEAGRLFGKRDHCGLAGALLRRLQVKVVERVGGEVEFGKDDAIDPACVRLARHGDGGVEVRGDVPDARARRRGGDADHLVGVDRVEGVRHGRGANPCGERRLAATVRGRGRSRRVTR